MAIVLVGHILCRVGAYHAEAPSELVLLRRWEIVFTCFFAISFIAFIAEHTGFRPHKFIIVIIGLWVILFAVNLLLPFGIQFIDAPQLTYLDLPWGERVVDIRVLKRSIWHLLGLIGILLMLGYALYASYLQYTTGNKKRGRGLCIAIVLFSVLVAFNSVINFADIKWLLNLDAI